MNSVPIPAELPPSHIELCLDLVPNGPEMDWSMPVASDHQVRFYENDGTLIRSVCDYVAEGLNACETCFVIATQNHLDGLASLLAERDVDLASMCENGRCVLLDAAETLSTFMVDNSPDRRRFLETVGRRVADAAATGRPVRAFGEMVAILYERGERSAAVELEELWNDLARDHRFRLLCAYHMDGFNGEDHTGVFADICACHSHVIPAESYVSLPVTDERLRQVAILQQKAKALETEIGYRREVEKTLRNRERELSDFFENAIEGLHKVGSDGSILWANQAELEMLGYAPEEYIGRHIMDFHADEDVIHSMMDKLVRGEALYNQPARLRCKDGSVKHVLIHSNGHFEDGKFVYTRCFTRDITERKEMEESLQKQLAEIEALNGRLKCSVTETHHRVKNNLQVISAMIEMLALEHKGESMVPLGDFSRIQSHVRTLAVVHDLLTASVKEDEDTQIISAKDVLERLLPMLQQTAWNKTVYYRIDDVLLPSKQCVSLALVINELVTNALKHGNTEAEVTFGSRGGEAELEVCDDGPGFPEDFDAVLCANTGLELVASLVKTDLRGHTRHENRVGGGARVVVTFALPDQED
jgi:PAS domain S-box-containing protein